MLTSTDDGLIWSPSGSLLAEFSTEVNSMASNNSGLVAAGSSFLFYSNNSSGTWTNTNVSSVSSYNLYSVYFANNKFIAVGNNGTKVIVLNLTNGTTGRTLVTSGPIHKISSLNSVTYFNGKWCAAGNHDSLLVSSDNGASWSYVFDSNIYIINYSAY